MPFMMGDMRFTFVKNRSHVLTYDNAGQSERRITEENSFSH